MAGILDLSTGGVVTVTLDVTGTLAATINAAAALARADEAVARADEAAAEAVASRDSVFFKVGPALDFDDDRLVKIEGVHGNSAFQVSRRRGLQSPASAVLFDLSLGDQVARFPVENFLHVVPADGFADDRVWRITDAAGNMVGQISRRSGWQFNDMPLFDLSDPTQRARFPVVNFHQPVPAADFDDDYVVRWVDSSGQFVTGYSLSRGWQQSTANDVPPDTVAPLAWLSSGDLVLQGAVGAVTVDGVGYAFTAVTSGGQQVKAIWDRPTLGATTLVAVSDDGAMIVPCARELMIGIVGYGQSLSVGSRGKPALLTDAPYPDHVLMADTGAFADVRMGLATGGVTASVFDPDTFTGFIPLRGNNNPVGPSVLSISGQVNLESLARVMQTEVRAACHFPPRLMAMTLGNGGLAYVNLAKGTQAYANLVAAVTKAAALAAAAGRKFWVPAIVLRHGESDAATAAYAANLVTWQGDIEGDLQAVLNQVGPIPFLMAAPSSFASGQDKAVLAMLANHIAHPSDFVLSHPSYMLDYDIIGTDDEVHLSNVGYHLDGEYFWKAWAKTIFSPTPWEPLRPLSATRSGANIDIVFSVPEPPLVLDTVTVTERSGTVKGFQYTDASSPPAISSVTLLDDTTVRVTLASTPSGSSKKIRIALQGFVTTPRDHAEQPRANLRDSDATPSTHDGRPLYNWVVPSEISVS